MIDGFFQDSSTDFTSKKLLSLSIFGTRKAAGTFPVRTIIQNGDNSGRAEPGVGGPKINHFWTTF